MYGRIKEETRKRTMVSRMTRMPSKRPPPARVKKSELENTYGASIRGVT